MRKNWLNFVSEEDFIEFIDNSLPEGYYMSDDNVVNGHVCERYSESYGKYFDLTLEQHLQHSDGTPYSKSFDFKLGQFGFVNVILKNGDLYLTDNVEHISNLNESTLLGALLIDWIKFVAQKTNGVVNNKGQDYYEDLTQRVENVVKEQKLIFTRRAERDLQSFEFPLAKGLEKVGSTATYIRQNRLQDAHNALLKFNIAKKQAQAEESDADYFS